MMEMIQELTLTPCPKSHIQEELVDQELFLYDARKDATYCFNSGAALIWLLCDGKRDLEGIAGELSANFDLQERQVLAEVQETVAEFQKLNLLSGPNDERSK